MVLPPDQLSRARKNDHLSRDAGLRSSFVIPLSRGIRLIPQDLAASHLGIFSRPAQQGFFNILLGFTF
jgi:hypothetical protein